MSKKLKIIGVLILSFIVAVLLNSIFIGKSPKPNILFISSLPNKINAFSLLVRNGFKPFPTKSYTLTPTPFSNFQPAPTEPYTTPTVWNGFKPFPTIILSPTNIPTSTPLILPTNIPTILITKQPNELATGSSCPTSSTQKYSTLHAERSGTDLPFGNPETSPEINLHLRGYGPVNESTGFIGRGGSTYGLDDQKPPQISTLFKGPRPQIAKTYIVYGWNFDSNKSAAPDPATPNYKVTMIGLQNNPGQKLVGLQAGRDIGGGNVFMVLYATNKDIVFTHSPSDTLLGGYLFFFLDICVDPNLLSAYQQANASGRNNLPVISPGQVFGTAGQSDIKVVVRDTMSFMDTRYNEDWWDY